MGRAKPVVPDPDYDDTFDEAPAPKPSNTHRFLFRIPKNLYSDVQDYAEQARLSTNEALVRILEDWVTGRKEPKEVTPHDARALAYPAGWVAVSTGGGGGAGGGVPVVNESPDPNIPPRYQTLLISPPYEVTAGGERLPFRTGSYIMGKQNVTSTSSSTEFPHDDIPSFK